MTPGDEAGSGPAPDARECVFRLPDLGEGLVSGEIIDWLVAVGDEVEVDQPVVVIETEKTTTELPVPYGGRVARLHGEVTHIVKVGAPLVTILASARPDRQAGTAQTGRTAHLVGQRPAMDAVPDREAPVRRLPPKPDAGRVAASPAVRRLARELSVELRNVTGTGKGGAITKDDVYLASRRAHGSGAD